MRILFSLCKKSCLIVLRGSVLRNDVLESVAGLGIILVVLGHSQGLPPSMSQAYSETSIFYAWFLSAQTVIYMFHMPLFFVISGYLFILADRGDGVYDFFLKKQEGFWCLMFLLVL